MQTCTLQPSAVEFSHTLGANAVGVFFSPFNCQILQDEGSIIPHFASLMTADEFVEVIRKGKLTDAIRKLNPIEPDGPWFALCDNEGFLRKAKATKEAVAEQGVSLWHIPPRSPDLNPVEKFWAWLRRELRRLDLKDRSKKKRPLANQHTRCASTPLVDRRKRNAWQVILPRA